MFCFLTAHGERRVFGYHKSSEMIPPEKKEKFKNNDNNLQ
jgi:hypothetical protein